MIRNKRVKIQETKLFAFGLSRCLIKENELQDRGKQLIKSNSYARIDVIQAFVCAAGGAKRALSFENTGRGLQVV